MNEKMNEYLIHKKLDRAFMAHTQKPNAQYL